MAKTVAALNDTNPATALNIFGSGFGINNPDTIKGLVIHPRNDGIAYIYSEDFKASGDLFSLPAGAVKLAIGGEYREEALCPSRSRVRSGTFRRSRRSNSRLPSASTTTVISLPATPSFWFTPPTATLSSVCGAISAW